MSGPAVKDVLSDASRMMSEHLLETESLSNLTADELAARLEMTRIAITGVLGDSFFMADDGFSFCRALGFDLGLAVRKPDGTEFIFYPARNFGPHSVQTSPKPAKQEEPPTPIPSPSAPVLLPAATHGSASVLPFAKSRKRPIGFIQQFLHPTSKAEAAAPDADAIPGTNEYEV